MVAAATQIQTAIGAPATGVPGADSAKGAGTPGSDVADNEFMQLLGSLIKGDSNLDQSATAVTKPDKNETADDKTASAAGADTPLWLMGAPMTAQIPQGTTQTIDQDEVETALTPANNVTANAMLSQSLKRLSDSKPETARKPESAGSGSESSFFTGKDADASTLDVMLKTAMPAGGTLSDSGQASAAMRDAPRVDMDAGNASAIPLMNSMHQTSHDIADLPVPVKVESHMGSRQWADEIGNHLSVLVASKSHSASLQLTPDNLGPVQVKIEVNSNQANVWFTADHPDTRTALEQSLPRLREMFASQGMSLMDAGVFGQHSQQQAPMFARNAQPSYGMTDMSTDVTTTQVILKVGLLDTYA